MVVFDTTVALLAFRPGSPPPGDPATGRPIEHADARVSELLERLGKARTRIVIPAPALCELLIRAEGDVTELVAQLSRSATFRVEPFDTRASIELALMTRGAMSSRDKREGVDAPYNKVRFDRQIVAIAKVSGAKTVYSDDRGLRTFAERQGLEVVGIADLPIPQAVREPPLPLPGPTGSEGAS